MRLPRSSVVIVTKSLRSRNPNLPVILAVRQRAAVLPRSIPRAAEDATMRLRARSNSLQGHESVPPPAGLHHSLAPDAEQPARKTTLRSLPHPSDRFDILGNAVGRRCHDATFRLEQCVYSDDRPEWEQDLACIEQEAQ